MMKKIGSTESLCPACDKRIPAFIYQRDGEIVIEKNCSEHGKFATEHIWDDPEIYEAFSKTKTIGGRPAQTAVILTYRCNLNCPTCLADANQLKIPDFKRKYFSLIDGGRAVLLTGGEPTTREDLPTIIRSIKKRKMKTVLLSNGLKLADRSYALKLKKAGLDCVRLQFDTLNNQNNLYIRGKKLLSIKKRAIKNLEALGISIILSSVILKKNFNEMKSLFEFAARHPKIKSVSVNPLWKLGRYRESDLVPSSKIIREASKILNLKKKDWIESTLFLVNLDKFLALFGKRDRHFCKCNIKCLFIYWGKIALPLTRIFNLQEINRRIERLYESKSASKIASFLVYLLIKQFMLNFLMNKYFRLFILKFIFNLKNILKKDFSPLDIFRSVSVESFMTKENFDFNVSRDCNLDGLSPESLSPKPACLNRLNLTK